MLLIKLLYFVLVVSLVNSVPIDKRENSDRNRPSTRRSTLEMYRFNHPPSISIPVSVVFEESEPGNDKSGKSLKLSTENPDIKPSLSQKPSSVGIPVSVVFEEKISDKSENINTNIPDKNPLLPESLSVAIPVSVVLEEETSVSNKSEKSKNLNPKISEEIPVLAVSEEKESQSEKALNSNQQSDVAVPVAVIFEEEEFSNFNALKSVKPSSDSTHNKQVHTEKTKIIDQQTVRPILTNTVSDNDIEVLTTNTTNVKTKLKEEPSKVILNPQPRQYYQLEYQIPVAVVYDDPINAVQMRRKLKKLKDQVRGRNSRRRRPTSTSTTEPTIEVTTSDENIQGNPLSNEDKPHNSRRQRVKQTQAKLSDKEDIPVVTKLPVDGIQTTKPNSREQRFSTTLVPTTEASSKKQTSNTRTPLQTQNRNASFKAQQTEERKQDNQSARKRERDPIIPIVKSDIHAYGNSGSFSYSYEGGDGTKAFEKGELKTFEDDKTGETVVGGFSYKDQDGKDISLTYTADENGYRPVGDHLPTPPPIPVAIQRALDYLATKTTPAAVTEASEA